MIVSNFTSENLLQQIRTSGIDILDLGLMLGTHTTLQNIKKLSMSLNQIQRGNRLYAQFNRHIYALKQANKEIPRRPGVYVVVYGNQIYGGTQGTSYHELLYLGGVEDIAPKYGYNNWPTYTQESLLKMNPPLIVTRPNMRKILCKGKLENYLDACLSKNGIVELKTDYHDDPGLGLVDAAEDLFSLVHGQKPIYLQTTTSSVSQLR